MSPTTQSATLDDVRLTAKRIFDLVSPELQLVEEEFERQARSNIQVIAYIGEYLRRSGGKRVRPALTILSNYAVGGDGANQSSIRMATVMEFLHTATLVHDDVIDKAETRRNRPSINTEFGNQTAVLMGDWLYMSAFETSLAERSLEILDILTAVTRKMTASANLAQSHGHFRRAVLRRHRAQDGVPVQRVLRDWRAPRWRRSANPNSDARFWNEFGRRVSAR